MAGYNDNPPEVQALSGVLNTFLRWKSLNGPPRGHEQFHPSAFGGCLRRMQYQRYAERGEIKVQQEAHEAKTVRIFDTGHAMHARWSKYWEDLGVLRGIWECINPCCRLWKDNGSPDPAMMAPNADAPNILTVNEFAKNYPPRKYGLNDKLGDFKPEKCACGGTKFHYHELTVHDDALNFHGHVDQILDFSRFPGSKMFKQGNPVKVLFDDADLPKKPILNDMKSVNSFGFKSKLEHGAPFGYRVQVNIYIHILDLDYGLLYFENKDDSNTRVIHVERDAALWEKIKEQALMMQEMSVDLVLPPPRPDSKESYDCRYCEYQSICHKSDVWKRQDLDNLRRKFYGDFS